MRATFRRLFSRQAPLPSAAKAGKRAAGAIIAPVLMDGHAGLRFFARFELSMPFKAFISDFYACSARYHFLERLS